MSYQIKEDSAKNNPDFKTKSALRSKIEEEILLAAIEAIKDNHHLRVKLVNALLGVPEV